jgi:hypothetical protein
MQLVSMEITERTPLKYNQVMKYEEQIKKAQENKSSLSYFKLLSSDLMHEWFEFMRVQKNINACLYLLDQMETISDEKAASYYKLMLKENSKKLIDFLPKMKNEKIKRIHNQITDSIKELIMKNEIENLENLIEQTNSSYYLIDQAENFINSQENKECASECMKEMIIPGCEGRNLCLFMLNTIINASALFILTFICLTRLETVPDNGSNQYFFKYGHYFYNCLYNSVQFNCPNATTDYDKALQCCETYALKEITLWLAAAQAYISKHNEEVWIPFYIGAATLIGLQLTVQIIRKFIIPPKRDYRGIRYLLERYKNPLPYELIIE